MMESSSSKLKQRLARMFRTSTLLGSACGSSNATSSILGSATPTSSRTFSTDVAHEPVFIPRHLRHRSDDALCLQHTLDRSQSISSSPGDHHRSARFSIDCGGCRPTRSSEAYPPPPMPKIKKKERRVRETGALYETGEGEGRMCPPTSPSSPSKNSHYCSPFKRMEEQKETKNKSAEKEATKKKKLLSNAYGFTSSSSLDDSDDDGGGGGLGFFSSEEGEAKEEETETFFSSRSFSSDSSGFYQRPSSNNNKAKTKRKKKSSRRRPRRGAGEGYRPLVSLSSGRGKEEGGGGGFAVVKRSNDPYGDFRSSMVEMMVERQLFGTEDLERLLRSYLSLNSPRHHSVILKAFSDIWEVLFCN